MPADPTIPELVARLRELRIRASFRSLGRPTREAERAEEQLRDELRSALPTLLDALERGQGQTWRPISEPPSAEVHAWCGGRYLFENDDGSGFVMTVNFDAGELEEFFGALTCARYLPIPPSDERRGW